MYPLLFWTVLLLLVVAGALLYRARGENAAAREHAQQSARNHVAELDAIRTAGENAMKELKRSYAAEIALLRNELERLEQFRHIADISAAASALEHDMATLRSTAERDAAAVIEQARLRAQVVMQDSLREADDIRVQANQDFHSKRTQAEQVLAGATRQADQTLRDASKQAEDIAGDAYRALRETEEIKGVATAMHNVIEGYGDRYLKPTMSLLDELAEAYSFDDAGQQLKAARQRTKLLAENSGAATCDYVEAHRRATAMHFVQDAFNGKVDSILSRIKADNWGTLEQQIRDAFALVNHNGTAFRNARITEMYLTARLDELKAAVLVYALRERDKEQQRQIREQIREEEKARREIERALKEAARDEEALEKAMEKMRGQVARANDAERAALEARLADLQAQLLEAEARGQRALSMAQQTKAGHVYVISNIGSFGEHVYKVGMTRRLEPLDRVRELGDASVPFSFDVHAMIWCDNAPQLEGELHKKFVQAQVNKVNPRKEFFRLSLSELRCQIENMGINAQWTMAATAAEYRESLAVERRLAANPAEATAWLEQQVAVAHLIDDVESEEA